MHSNLTGVKDIVAATQDLYVAKTIDAVYRRSNYIKISRFLSKICAPRYGTHRVTSTTINLESKICTELRRFAMTQSVKNLRMLLAIKGLFKRTRRERSLAHSSSKGRINHIGTNRSIAGFGNDMSFF